MATTNGNGAPTKRTPGAVGDIYTDSTTGQQYKCTFAYRSNGGEFDCEWKRIGDANQKKPIPKRAQESRVNRVQENKGPEKKPILEDVAETNISRRKDYSAYSKRNK